MFSKAEVTDGAPILAQTVKDQVDGRTYVGMSHSVFQLLQPLAHTDDNDDELLISAFLAKCFITLLFVICLSVTCVLRLNGMA